MRVETAVQQGSPSTVSSRTERVIISAGPRRRTVSQGPAAGREVLSNPASARISRVAGLSRRNARAKHRRFLVEGPQGVREAVRHAPGRVLDVYLTEAALERHVARDARKAQKATRRSVDPAFASPSRSWTP